MFVQQISNNLTLAEKMLKHQNTVDTTGAFFLFRYRQMNPQVSIELEIL